MAATIATLQAQVNQFNQINTTMPQVQTDTEILAWLRKVLMKGEGALASMSRNIPVRSKDGYMNLGTQSDDQQKPVNFVLLNKIAGDPSDPYHDAVRNAIRLQDQAGMEQAYGPRRRFGVARPAQPGPVRARANLNANAPARQAQSEADSAASEGMDVEM
jgi:uncharacterized protein (UPF0147 family)